MKFIYSAPELELITLKVNDVILASTEGTIPVDINPGGGDGPQDPFTDDLG